MKPFCFEIEGHPATKKNSSVMVRGQALILPSKAYRLYEKRFREALSCLGRKQGLPHFDGPVWIIVSYWLESKAHWPDLTGLMQATADILSDEYKVVNHKRTLVREWLLSDDRIIKSWDGSRIAGIDKQRPRIEVKIIPLPMDAEAEMDPKLRKLAAEKMQGSMF